MRLPAPSALNHLKKKTKKAKDTGNQLAHRIKRSHRQANGIGIGAGNPGLGKATDKTRSHGRDNTGSQVAPGSQSSSSSDATQVAPLSKQKFAKSGDARTEQATAATEVHEKHSSPRQGAQPSTAPNLHPPSLEAGSQAERDVSPPRLCSPH